MTGSVSPRPARQIVRFCPYQLDTGLRRLVRAGIDVPRPPEPTSFLISLLQQAGTLVPKQYLVREIQGRRRRQGQQRVPDRQTCTQGARRA